MSDFVYVVHLGPDQDYHVAGIYKNFTEAQMSIVNHLRMYTTNFITIVKSRLGKDFEYGNDNNLGIYINLAEVNEKLDIVVIENKSFDNVFYSLIERYRHPDDENDYHHTKNYDINSYDFQEFYSEK